jgi:hypothetical protein
MDAHPIRGARPADLGSMRVGIGLRAQCPPSPRLTRDAGIGLLIVDPPRRRLGRDRHRLQRPAIVTSGNGDLKFQSRCRPAAARRERAAACNSRSPIPEYHHVAPFAAARCLEHPEHVPMSYRKTLLILVLATLARPILAQTALNWNPPSTASPVPMCCMGMTYDAARRVTVLFGGSEGYPNYTVHAETWTLSAGGWTLMSPATSPTPRDSMAMAFDPVNGVTVMFGGTNNAFGGASAYFQETWLWDGTNWIQLQIANQPPIRITAAQGMAYDAASGALVLFGGLTPDPKTNALNGLNDTWTLRLTQTTTGWSGTWTQHVTPANGTPEARRPALSRYKASVVLYGGDAWANNAQTATYNDIWHWNGTGWKKLIANGAAGSPAPQVLPGLTWDPATSQEILFAGNTSNEDTWAFSISAGGVAGWTQLFPVNTPNLPHRFDFGMTYDPGAGIEIFGGYADCCADNDLWFLK